MSLWLPGGYRGESELEVKRSRFIATVARVDDEAAAREVVAELRRQRRDARHHCSAFIVEVEGAQAVERSSDDGEPSGTAGMPMLDVLRGAGISQVVAVVSRYFGGVLLGTGGLVRAYSDAVAGALEAAPRVQPLVRPRYRVRVPHEIFGRAHADLLASGFEVVSAEFGAAAELVLACDPRLDAHAAVARVLHGAGEAEAAGSTVTEVPLRT